MDATRNTLVVHFGAIGDFLLMCPTLAHLSHDGTVEVAGRLERVRLAVVGGLASAAHDLDAIDFGTVFSTPSPRLRPFLSRFDRAVIWTRDDGAIARHIHEAGVREVFTFHGLPPSGWTRHASAYFLQQLGLPECEREPLLAVPAVEPRHDIVVHCGSGGAAKNWPWERYCALTAALEKAGRRVTWSMGPAEEKLAPPDGAETLRDIPLEALARVLRSAALYIGNDSGVTHLAAAVGCPVVVLFGPTDPRVWAPRGPGVRVIQGRPWPEVDEVFALAMGQGAAR